MLGHDGDRRRDDPGRGGLGTHVVFFKGLNMKIIYYACVPILLPVGLVLLCLGMMLDVIADRRTRRELVRC